MELIDSHCHLDFPEFSDVDQLIQQCRPRGITRFIIPATEPKHWPRIQELCHTHPECYWAAGLHPWWVNQENFTQLKNEFHQAIEDPKCIAVGECGLDGSRELEALHIEVLSWQLEQACAANLPLILHAHKAQHKLLPLLKQTPNITGVVHGFSGSLELAQSYIRLGFKLGIGGSITYPRATKTRKAVQAIDLQHMLLETDAPAMPINGKQGQPNSPYYLHEILGALATLKHSEPALIAQSCTQNTRRLFKL